MKAYFASEVSTAEYKNRVESFYGRLTSEQYSSILYYSDSGHKKINYSSSPLGADLAVDVNSALDCADTGWKTVYRASDDFSGDDLAVNSVVSFPAFVSTSYNPQVTFKFLNKDVPTVYVIRTCHGAEISMVHDEMEVLLPKGLTFKVDKIETVDFHAAYPDTDYHVSRENVKTVYLTQV